MGINKELHSLNRITNLDRSRIVNKLEQERGLSRKIIDEALDIWCEAYDILMRDIPGHKNKLDNTYYRRKRRY